MNHYKKKSLLVVFFLMTILGYSQNTVILHVPKALEANTGDDVTVAQNTAVTLGANPSAQFGLPPYQYLWTPGGFTSPNPVVTPGVTTEYLLNVTDDNGCQVQDVVTIYIDPIGVDKVSTEDGISIFPNPNTGKLTIDFQELKGKVQLSFFDMNGKQIIEKVIDLDKSNLHSYDLSDYPAGQYLLTITGDDIPITRSIIKE
ncbi:MAG: T9SS type A sorting domain-containing protein [Bacteroidales bacterium]|nr:T9SS type A sorting domain-containing protein [Bacteroidales bacterium]MCF8458092.1 T9SS type A sorting domain-containing protein [Bacteroidales bacterium]